MGELLLANESPAAAVDHGRPDRALGPTMPVSEALRLVMSDCRVQIGKQRSLLLTSDDPEGVHQTRVALRRIRAVLKLFGDAVDDPELRSIDAEARRLARECGPARELHAFLSETAPDAPAEVVRAGSALIDRRLQRARQALSGEAFARFDTKLKEFASRPPAAKEETLDSFGRRELDACLKRVRRRGRAMRRLRIADLHKLRIAAKKLRYAATFLAPIFPSSQAEEYIETIEALQDALGVLNDRIAGKRILDDITAEGEFSEHVRAQCRRLAKRFARGTKRERRRIEKAWRVFKEAKPFWGNPLSTPA